LEQQLLHVAVDVETHLQDKDYLAAPALAVLVAVVI
jgi:hypothetical protein